MFGMGMSEILLILVVALVFIGPKKLPEVAKGLGKGYAEFRKYINEFKDAVDLNSEPAKSSAPHRAQEVYEEHYKDVTTVEAEEPVKKEETVKAEEPAKAEAAAEPEKQEEPVKTAEKKPEVKENAEG
jgi:Tat protein translocase TatB subunit